MLPTCSTAEMKNCVVESESSIQPAQPGKVDFWTAYLAFRQHYQLDDLGLDSDSIFADVRDRSPGRDINL